MDRRRLVGADSVEPAHRARRIAERTRRCGADPGVVNAVVDFVGLGRRQQRQRIRRPPVGERQRRLLERQVGREPDAVAAGNMHIGGRLRLVDQRAHETPVADVDVEIDDDEQVADALHRPTLALRHGQQPVAGIARRCHLAAQEVDVEACGEVVLLDVGRPEARRQRLAFVEQLQHTIGIAGAHVGLQQVKIDVAMHRHVAGARSEVTRPLADDDGRLALAHRLVEQAQPRQRVGQAGGVVERLVDRDGAACVALPGFGVTAPVAAAGQVQEQRCQLAPRRRQAFKQALGRGQQRRRVVELAAPHHAGTAHGERLGSHPQRRSRQLRFECIECGEALVDAIRDAQVLGTRQLHSQHLGRPGERVARRGARGSGEGGVGGGTVGAAPMHVGARQVNRLSDAAAGTVGERLGIVRQRLVESVHAQRRLGGREPPAHGGCGSLRRLPLRRDERRKDAALLELQGQALVQEAPSCRRQSVHERLTNQVVGEAPARLGLVHQLGGAGMLERADHRLLVDSGDASENMRVELATAQAGHLEQPLHRRAERARPCLHRGAHARRHRQLGVALGVLVERRAPAARVGAEQPLLEQVAQGFEQEERIAFGRFVQPLREQLPSGRAGQRMRQGKHLRDVHAFQRHCDAAPAVDVGALTLERRSGQLCTAVADDPDDGACGRNRSVLEAGPELDARGIAPLPVVEHESAEVVVHQQPPCFGGGRQQTLPGFSGRQSLRRLAQVGQQLGEFASYPAWQRDIGRRLAQCPEQTDHR